MTASAACSVRDFEDRVILGHESGTNRVRAWPVIEERGKRKNGSIEREVRILPSSWRVANQARGLDPRPPRPRPRRGCKGCQDRHKKGLALKGLPTSSLKLQR
ncbi:uncharacterized protein LOC122534708 [Frieseomelitta varia]|uniref:uncharacterized protein LOC122534708 n=1 Tax=Frieseomelitta varia TaxID=561572 RepID=UPI001CB68375|nr:uncharacterized protein LOC122534708 [Frieseomelitta varia]